MGVITPRDMSECLQIDVFIGKRIILALADVMKEDFPVYLLSIEDTWRQTKSGE